MSDNKIQVIRQAALEAADRWEKATTFAASAAAERDYVAATLSYFNANEIRVTAERDRSREDGS